MKMDECTDSVSKEKSMRSSLIAGALDAGMAALAFSLATSTVLLADFLQTFIEMTAIFLSWMAMRRISKGGGNVFEYGIGKLENISSIVVGIIMIVSVFIIAGGAFVDFLHPEHIEGPGLWISIAGQAVYLFINGKETLKNMHLGKVHSSPIFQSQARLFLTRFIGNLFILASVTMSMSLQSFKWSVYIDPVSSLIIGGFILVATIGMFSSSFFDLLDRTIDEEHQLIIIRELATFFNDYEELHGIRSRRSGSRIFIEIFLEFSPEAKMEQVHSVADAIRGNIEAKIKGSSVTIGLSRESVK